MRRTKILMMIALLSASSADAGAWLREKGKGFASLSTSVRSTDGLLGYETSIYADYGLRERLSVGLDINENLGNAGHALLFVRLPIGGTDRPARIATELAIGGHHSSGQWHGMYKLSMAWGRGFDHKWLGSGWMTAEAAYERRLGSPAPIYKLDANMGLSAGGWARPLLKLETAYIPGSGLNWAVSPALMITGRKNTTFVAGLEYRQSGQRMIGVNFSVWRNF